MNAKQTMDVLLNFPVEESILICGNHGIGKSQIVKQAAKKLGIPCIDFRLSQNDVGDLKGMPFHVNGRTVFAPPEFMPLTEEDTVNLKELLGLSDDIKRGRYGDKGILFLDEINRASREVQQAAFELVLDRRMNLRPLPAGWRVVSAINDEDDIYSVNTLDPAFLSRFFVIKFEPTTQEWLTWAAENKVHAAITGFIEKNPTLLDPTKEMLTEASTKGISKVHDRRAWVKFSNTITKLTADHEAGTREFDPLSKTPKSMNSTFMIAVGYVGALAATSFKNFIETDYQALDAYAILNKWDKTVEGYLKGTIEKGRIPELAIYNDLLISYIKANIKDKLSDEQSKNLTKYLDMLPNELIGDFWQKFNQDHKEIAEKWYQSKKNKEIVLRALLCPDVKKKESAAPAATK